MTEDLVAWARHSLVTVQPARGQNSDAGPLHLQQAKPAPTQHQR